MFCFLQKNVEELIQAKGGGLSQDGSVVCFALQRVDVIFAK
jgi:hypothetical protein